MARKKKVATQDEVLEFFTTVMRREADDGKETGVVLLPMLQDNEQQDKKGE